MHIENAWARWVILAAGLGLAAPAPAWAMPINFDFSSYALASGGSGNPGEMDPVPAGLAFSSGGGLIGSDFTAGGALEVVATGQVNDARGAGAREDEAYAYLSDESGGLGVCSRLNDKGHCASSDGAVNARQWTSEVLTLAFSSDVFLAGAAFSNADGTALEDGRYLLNGVTRSFGDGDFSVLDAASVWTFEAVDAAFYLDALSIWADDDKSVPEPGVLLLLTIALLMLSGIRRRQYRNMGLP